MTETESIKARRLRIGDAVVTGHGTIQATEVWRVDGARRPNTILVVGGGGSEVYDAGQVVTVLTPRPQRVGGWWRR